MEITTLKNEQVTVKLKDFGGELTSIQDAQGVEYLWQGNPDFWSGQAPVLFPIIGCLRDGQASIGGDKTCHFARHGIVRRKQFALGYATETEALYVLRADDETKEAYPYDFELQMIYTLTDRGVKVAHRVINHDCVDMPFCVGGHPAFNCPISEGESYEDYQVEFECEETADCALLTADGLIDNDNRVSRLKDSKVMPVTHEMFYTDAIVFDTLKSRKASLKHKTLEKGIEVSFADFDYLGVWASANDADFVAIEPWSGTSTLLQEDDIFEHKRGVKILAPGEEITLSFTIEIL